MNKFYKISEEQFKKDFGDSYTTLENIKLPCRATIQSAGYDFFAPYTLHIPSGHTLKIPTGISVELDSDKFLAIVPRSGLGFKYRLQLDNTIGIIDSDFFNTPTGGHIWAKITNDSREGKDLTIQEGEAFAQGIILTYNTTCDDDVKTTRVGGFGSTSKIKNSNKDEQQITIDDVLTDTN